jgi:DNA-binding MarR family transcriptional regulator
MLIRLPWEMSTDGEKFREAVADVLGLHITDHKSLYLIHRFGAMPTSRLAELTGLSTGAVTGIIDRLEEASYVRRINDPKDRRRTIVEPTRDRHLHERMHTQMSSYSDSELAFLLDAVIEFIDQIHEDCETLLSVQP